MEPEPRRDRAVDSHVPARPHERARLHDRRLFGPAASVAAERTIGYRREPLASKSRSVPSLARKAPDCPSLDLTAAVGIANSGVVIPTASEANFGERRTVEISGGFDLGAARLHAANAPSGKLVDFCRFSAQIRRHGFILLDFWGARRPGWPYIAPLHAFCANCTTKNHVCRHYRHI